MTAYYNEIDPFAAQWLRNLIAAGHIAPGDVDERSIEDVQPDDLTGYDQCHFFAGIGVWSYALRLAGWPDDRPVWTGSCPCQPFSAAGRRGGFDDARHLWPAWQRLIAERSPRVVFGEQVASKDGYAWLDAVQSDVEGLGYACGPVVLPAAGFGAPHGRHRIYFVADDQARRRSGLGLGRSTSGMADADGWNSGTEREQRSGKQRQQPKDSGLGSVAHDRSGGLPLALLDDESSGVSDRVGQAGVAGVHGTADGGGADSTDGFWRGPDWLLCRDRKWRPVEPGTFPLAHGTPARVGRLRAYGNAIVAPVAAEFIRAYMGAV